MASSAELAIVIQAQNQAKAELRGLRADLAALEAQVTKTSGAFARISQTAGGFLAANVISKGFDALKNGIGGAISQASKLNESQNAVQVVFGKSADQILKFGETAKTSVGLSQAAFQQLVTPLGAMLQNAGIDDATGKTLELTQRAADMASVFNTDVPTALQAVQAAFRGEIDPIERFGVSMNAAAVEAKALELGFKPIKGEFDASAKAAARYALIMEQTRKVQGDFKNTQGEVANGNRTLSASFQDLQAKLGTKLTPLLKDVQNSLIALSNNKGFLNALTAGMDGAIGAVQGFAGAVKTAFTDGIIPAFRWIQDNQGALVAAITGIGVAFAIFFPGAALIVGLTAVITAIGVLTADVDKASPQVLKLRLAFLGIAEGAINAFDTISGVVVSFISGPLDLLRQALNAIIEQFNNINSVKLPVIGKVGVPDIPTIPNPLQSLVQSGVGAARDFINSEQAKTLEALNSALTEVGGSATKTAAVAATLPPVLNATADALGKLGQSALDVLNQAASSILGKPSREQANLQLEIAKQERALQAGQSGGNNLNAGVKAFMEQQLAEMKAQLSLLEQERGIQKARLTAADQTLLTERQIGQAVALLETNIRGVSSRIVQGFAGPGGFIPELQRAATAIKDFITAMATGKLPEGFNPTAKAMGGPVKAGMPFLVGEKGPELFVPERSGAILPNGAFRTAANGAYGSLDWVVQQIAGLVGKDAADAYRRAWAGADRNWQGLGGDDAGMLREMAESGMAKQGWLKKYMTGSPQTLSPAPRDTQSISNRGGSVAAFSSRAAAPVTNNQTTRFGNTIINMNFFGNQSPSDALAFARIAG